MMTSQAKHMRLTQRRVLELAGPDARAVLQRVITTDVDPIELADCRAGALLTPQGKILCDFLVFADGETVWIDIAESASAALLKRLTMYKLKADVSLRLADDLVPVISADALSGLPSDPRLTGLLWRGIHAADDSLPVGDDALSALEIANGIPAFGRDYGEAEVFPTDVNLDLYEGVGWKKGCFIGQEVVSRMKRRGTIRKRSLALRVAGEAPDAGTPVKAGTATLGEITSSLGSDAVALIRIDRLEAADSPPMAGEAEAEIDLPDTHRPEAPAAKV